MNFLKIGFCLMLLAAIPAKAGCDFITTEDGKALKMPAWAKKDTVILPTDIASQAMGFKRMSANGTPDGVWEWCGPGNKLFLKFGAKNGWMDGIYEGYDRETGALAIKGQYKEGLRVGVWKMRNEDGALQDMAFKNGLPAVMFDTEDGRKGAALMKFFMAPEMDENINETMVESAEEQGVKYKLDDRAADVDQGLNGEAQFWQEGFERMNQGLQDALRQLQSMQMQQ